MLRKIVLFLFVSFAVVACQKDKYQLKWKVPSGDVVIYSIKMETIDSLSSVSEEGLQELVELVAKMYGDSVEVAVNTDDLYQGLVKQLNLLSYFSIIRQGSGDDLKVDFITRQTKQYGPIKYKGIFTKFIKKAFFKGALQRGGNLVSDAGEAAWDPKINILFQLPSKPVAIGESWSLNVVPEWQVTAKEQADSMKNTVTLTDIVVEGADTIAILNYDLQSPDKSGRTLGFNGEAKFNINAGKWVSYTGRLSQKTVGMLAMKHVQQIKLTEISVEKYKAILKQAQKVDIFDTGKDFDENNNTSTEEEVNEETVEDEKKNETSEVNCPEVFRVQLLASQKPVADKAAQFKGVNYPVEEIVLSEKEKFKYKYTVGKECDREKINLILAEVKKAGYPNAYVIKTPAK
jgi:hypothetical protein